jgi:hypothetical protein
MLALIAASNNPAAKAVFGLQVAYTHPARSLGEAVTVARTDEEETT